MEKYLITRDGKSPLSFTGEELGNASSRTVSGHDSTRWTTIHLYRTKKGNFIALKAFRTQWQGESDHNSAESFSDFPSLIAWLRDEDQTLPPTAQEAIENAVKHDPTLAAHWVKEIE